MKYSIELLMKDDWSCYTWFKVKKIKMCPVHVLNRLERMLPCVFKFYFGWGGGRGRGPRVSRDHISV